MFISALCLRASACPRHLSRSLAAPFSTTFSSQLATVARHGSHVRQCKWTCLPRVASRSARTRASMETKRRFVLAFKKYTTFSWKELLELLNRELEISEEEEEDLVSIFTRRLVYQTNYEKQWHQALTITTPTRLRGQELLQLQQWLKKYSPETWPKLMEGKLRVKEYASFTILQTRFILVLDSLLSKRD